MTLTAKQEAFAQAVAGGMNQADAYRSAYNPKPMNVDALYVRAHEVAKNSKVLERTESLKAATAAKALWTRERSVVALANIADSSEAKANEITAAIKELNLMHGFNAPTKLEIEGAIIHRIERHIVNASHTDAASI